MNLMNLFLFFPIRNICLLLLFLWNCIILSQPILAQQNDTVDFIKAEATVIPDALNKKVEGKLTYTFKMLKSSDSVYLDAVNMKVQKTSSDKIRIKATSDKIWFLSNFQSDSTYSVSFSYIASPNQTLYFFENAIWTQGQGKYTSHWLPSLDDTNDKIEFDLTVAAPLANTVIANGLLTHMTKKEDLQYWHFNMDKPMSSYLVAMAIGDFKMEERISKSGKKLQLFNPPKDSLKVEPTYRYSKDIFDFLEDEIGFSYPWSNYKQVPLRDFLYAGMENTSATFFSQAFMVDSIGFHDRNFINVNAHELAHQWFGNLVTAKDDAHHWLQEGFATYYALLTEKQIFGEDYFYWQLYQSAEQLKALSDEGKGESLLNPKASSLTFYQKGAWALHILKETIGEKPFKDAVKNYLNKYQYSLATTDDFMNEVKAVTDVDLQPFQKKWIEQTAFQSEEAYQSLLRSNFIQNYFEVAALRPTALADKQKQIKAALASGNDFIGEEAVFQLLDEPWEESRALYKAALNSNNLFIRQAVALSLNNIAPDYKTEFETLLNDQSYVTKEAVLYKLWSQFPKDRIGYLEKTKGVTGFQNKNIRQLWLALAILTENYNVDKKNKYINELRAYSSPSFSFEIRELSLNYLYDLNLWNQESLLNLIEACVHPNWRFAKSSRDILNDLLARDGKMGLDQPQIQQQLSEKAKTFLLKLLRS